MTDIFRSDVEKSYNIPSRREIFATSPHNDNTHCIIGLNFPEHGPKMFARRDSNDVEWGRIERQHRYWLIAAILHTQDGIWILGHSCLSLLNSFIAEPSYHRIHTLPPAICAAESCLPQIWALL